MVRSETCSAMTETTIRIQSPSFLRENTFFTKTIGEHASLIDGFVALFTKHFVVPKTVSQKSAIGERILQLRKLWYVPRFCSARVLVAHERS